MHHHPPDNFMQWSSPVPLCFFLLEKVHFTFAVRKEIIGRPHTHSLSLSLKDLTARTELPISNACTTISKLIVQTNHEKRHYYYHFPISVYVHFITSSFILSGRLVFILFVILHILVLSCRIFFIFIFF